MKIIDRIQSLPIIRRINFKYEFRFWLNFACIALMILWFIISILTTDYSKPFIAWHTITGHHYLVLLLGFIFPFFYYWIKKGLRPLWSFIIVAFTLAVNEWFWWITYYIDHYILNNTNYYLPPPLTNQYLQFQALEHLTIFNYTGMAYIIVIALFLYKVKIHKPEFLVWLSFLTVFYIYWLSIGFPITIDFSGITVLLNDFNTNLIEITHWLIFTTLLVIFYNVFFGQNSELKGLPPIIFKLYFKGTKTPDLIELEKKLLLHPHYDAIGCDNHIVCNEYDDMTKADELMGIIHKPREI